MRPKKIPARRKCCICWRWFRPHFAAAKTQRVCFRPECRRELRGRQAQARRSEDLPLFQRAERDRQRGRRKKLAESLRMSRASLSWEVSGFIEKTLEKLAEDQEMSRASLRRQLVRVVRLSLAREAKAQQPPLSTVGAP
jgi:hypothetical protein